MFITAIWKLKTFRSFVLILCCCVRMSKGDLNGINLGIVLLENWVLNPVLRNQKTLKFHVLFKLLLVSLTVYISNLSFSLTAWISIIDNFKFSQRWRSKLWSLQIFHECLSQSSLSIDHRLSQERILAQCHPIKIFVLAVLCLVSKETLSSWVQLCKIIFLVHVSFSPEKVRLFHFVLVRRGLKASKWLHILSCKRVKVISRKGITLLARIRVSSLVIEWAPRHSSEGVFSWPNERVFDYTYLWHVVPSDFSCCDWLHIFLNLDGNWFIDPKVVSPKVLLK